MRNAVVLAIALTVLAGCRGPADALARSTPTAMQSRPAGACPDGKPALPGLTEFGAYIGTWQALHQRVPQTSDYLIAPVAGRVLVQCSSANFVILERINLTFPVPSGRALQFALTELPSDSKRIYDHTRGDCRTLQYDSSQLARQLPGDDAAGLADIAVVNLSTPNSGALETVVISTGSAVGDDTKSCASS